VLNYSVDKGYLEANPATRLRKYTEESRDRFVEADEFPRFWTALEAEPNEKLRDYFKIALFTGQRRGNVLSMRWEDINLDSATWTIPKTKTGKHSVPLTVAAVEILKRRREEAAEDAVYVFPSRQHGCGHLVEPTPVWRSILKRAGIENLRIHDLRRSMGSWQAITNASLPIIGKTLGHSQAQTTSGYARLSSDPVRAAMETATAAMMDAAKPKE
jgi:integrase